ncbi:prepilin peptidase [Tranquillimonas alkanivorans]|uniref:Prepilin peptidase CpaA n=1 Tax=Tranquillimonas alkanivorans TaxID=441119 RepID=A0A1I5MAB7_9RHOB|nr:prepilin peptidase [Tranquillimonas alkanivorans]SFP05961.1 prepilin peptidase CpaA [Tranquillimonas alkanivorans]
MLALPDHAALAFLPFALPVCFWVAWSDMARMKIPNLAVLALMGLFLLVGPLVLPLPAWGWAWMHFAVVLLAGFVLNLVGALGAGDAKFSAAAAPFVAPADAGIVLYLLATVTLAAFVTHRAARAVPAIRGRVAHWESWHRTRDFPMGMPLAGTLAAYLALAAAGA